MKKQLFTMFILAIGFALFLGLAMPVRGAGMKTAPLAPPFRLYLPLVKHGPPPCSTAPALVNPANGSTLNNLIPLFEWNSGNDPNATIFMLQVAGDPGFNQVAKSLGYGSGHGPGNYRFWSNFDPATTYYWRAYLMCGEGVQSPYSEVWSFTSGSGGTILPAPGLIAPADGSPLPSTSAVLQWSPISGAVEYQVHYQKSGGGSYVVITTATQYSFDGLSPSSAYEWWSAARNDYAWSIDSAHWTFTTGTGAVGQGLHSGINK